MVEAYLPPSYHQHLHLPLPAQNDIPSSPQENLLNLLLLHLLILLLKPFLFLHLLLLLLLPISFPLHLAILACSAFSWLALIIQSPVLPCKQPSLLPPPAFPPSTLSLPYFQPSLPSSLPWSWEPWPPPAAAAWPPPAPAPAPATWQKVSEDNPP